jgi:hypothetical protein
MRKTIDFTITRDGRDKGKTFVITEMSASQGERWGQRAINAMSKANMALPADLLNGGMAAFVSAGLSAFISAPFEDIRPLLDEMFACIQIKEPAIIRALTEEDIEEIETRVLLRQEVLDLHLGFFKAAVQLISVAATAAKKQHDILSAIQIYPTQSEQS